MTLYHLYILMQLIPAIDIRQGRCVRLRQGDMSNETVFDADPISAAERWVGAGALRLHIVDLDGATEGRPVNAGIIRAIADRYSEIPLQVGGGIRDEDTVDAYLEAGVQYVIIGTRAVNEPHFVSDLCAEFPGHIIVGLDARDGRIATDGWSKLSGHEVVDLAQHFENDGVAAIVYTDIERDGMLSGVNVEATARLAESVRIPVIAAGGVRDLDDIRALVAVQDSGVEAVITGRAIYEGTLDFRQGQQLAAGRPAGTG